MAAICESALTSAGRRTGRLTNIEVNNLCALTRQCAKACILNLLHRSSGRTLGEARHFQLAAEVMAGSQDVEALVLAGKEPTETPERVLGYLRAFHATPEAVRPGSIGMISASSDGLLRLSGELQKSPLGFLLVSADSATDTGLRNEAQPNDVLTAASEVKAAGGCAALGVNTIFRRGVSHLPSIASHLAGFGVDEWNVSAFLAPGPTGAMEVQAPPAILLAAFKVLRQISENVPFQINLGIEPSRWEGLPGGRVARIDRGWRTHWQVSPNFAVHAVRENAGFLRVRHDGECFSKRAFLKIGQREGDLGRIEVGWSKLLDRAAEIHESVEAA